MEIWNRSQRAVLAVLLLGLCVYLAIRLWRNPQYVPENPPEEGALASQLVGRVDPNTAPWEQLAALPGLGEKRAREIIAYRQQYALDHPGLLAFAKPEDLLKIRGVGASMLETLEPYLAFPSTAPTTRP